MTNAVGNSGIAGEGAYCQDINHGR